MAVVALLTDVVLRLRLVDALKGAVPAVDGVAHVRDARARLAAGDVRLLVVGPRDAGGLAVAPFAAEVRSRWPSVTVVAYSASGAGSSEDILALARAGVHALVVRGVDDERYAFRAALRAAEQACVSRLVYERVRDHLPAAVAPLVALYLRADGEPPSVAAAAEALGVHRKTLVNRLAAVGCPTPRALRTWCRLFVAARLLEEPGRTVESVAMQLDFDTPAGLRNTLKRYTGAGAGAVRAAGGLAHVLARFNAACAAHRPRRADVRGAAALPLPAATGAPSAVAAPTSPPASQAGDSVGSASGAERGLRRRTRRVLDAAGRAVALLACLPQVDGLDDWLSAAIGLW